MTTNQPDRLDRIESLLEKLSADFYGMKIEQLAVNTRLDAYQKASN